MQTASFFQYTKKEAVHNLFIHAFDVVRMIMP